jgi:AcrR family transcriptional regulator
MTHSVVTYNGPMRWNPDARGRLERAAFELFSEQGYAATTVPQITERAGLTTRSFFRYFPDKREVIFGGNEIPDTAARLIRTAPPTLEPMDVIRLVLYEVATKRFDGYKEQTAAWRRLIDANDSLRDRDARKRADLVLAARAAFIDRGESEFNATLLAEAGALVFHVALNQWVTEQDPRSMADTIADVMKLLHIYSTPQ